jgi:hypothetical protein
MAESSGLLLESIAKANAIAEQQRRPTVAHLLNLAADAAIDERPLAATEHAGTVFLSGGAGDGRHEVAFCGEPLSPATRLNRSPRADATPTE